MPRPERPLNPADGPLAEFAAALRALRVAAGSPKYSTMATRTGRSSTALSDAAGGRHLPKWPTVEAYVQACDGDVAEWRRRWERLRAELGEQDAGWRPSRRAVIAGGAVLAAGAVTLLVVRKAASGHPDEPRLLTPRHPSGPVSLSFPRFFGDRLATADAAGVVRIWDTAAGEVARTIDTGDPQPTLVAFDPLNRQVLATTGPDGLIRLWDHTDGSPLRTLPGAGPGGKAVLAFDPHNRDVLVAGVAGRPVTFWDIGTGLRIRVLSGPPAAVTALAFDPLTRNTLAVAGRDGPVTVFDTSNGKPVRELDGSFRQVTALAFDPLTRNTVVTGEAGAATRVWDSSDGRPVRPVRTPRGVSSLAFNPLIRNSLAAAPRDGTVQIFDASTGLHVHTLIGGADPADTIAYDRNGVLLAAAYADGRVRLWPIRDFR
ncbi:WD40 repeat domain-containing protein [Actinoplanes aureus]|jgi:WD40 repeat protein|uniref:WD40 repeat domain-containing protein n=1 Tax=Actinoplanes aureus TaxID=2792083 RepID=A0A931G243_9ACTN|nr:WD40 repeat domain-containing protein [Actinoplanes aureus]MBG0567297.1 WD40 repeat domain-containing protein [Actinoplanes aureus]